MLSGKSHAGQRRRPRRPDLPARLQAAPLPHPSHPEELAVAKPKGRTPKQISSPRDADGIRELAAPLRDIAKRIEGYAGQMENLNISSIRPLVGNFTRAVKKLEEFMARQLLAKIASESHEFFRPGEGGQAAGRGGAKTSRRKRKA